MAREGSPESRLGQEMKEQGRAAYLAARTRLFNMKAEDVGVAEPPEDTEAWGVAIDYPASQMTCTLAILADGTVDLMLSEGPVIVGAGQFREVARAAEKVLSAARSLHASFQRTSDYSLPDDHCTRVYLLTSTGVHCEEVLPNASNERQRRLAEICRLGDAVITAIRKRHEPP